MDVCRGAVIAPVALLVGCATLNKLPEGPLAISVAERSGRVLIIREPSYLAAAPGVEIEIGDRVVTLAKASATLRYALLNDDDTETGQSCQIELPPNSELVVGGADDCAEPPINALSSEEDSGGG